MAEQDVQERHASVPYDGPTEEQLARRAAERERRVGERERAAHQDRLQRVAELEHEGQKERDKLAAALRSEWRAQVEQVVEATLERARRRAAASSSAAFEENVKRLAVAAIREALASGQLDEAIRARVLP